MALVSGYGMHFATRNAQIIARAQAMSDGEWDLIPIETIPARTPLNAYRETVGSRHIESVASGDIPLREDYVTRLWRDGDGGLYIVDGHARTAIYYAINRPMPVRIAE